MAIQNKLYTAEELWEMSHQAGNSDKRFELVNGEIIEMSPTGDVHGIMAAEILRLIANYIDANDLGNINAAETGYRLSKDTVRAPDVSFIAKDRIAPLTGKYYTIAPDLAVEVVSPNDGADEIQERTRDFLQAGTKQVWIVYPKLKAIHVYKAIDNIEILGIDGTLSGGDVLPGFSVSMREVFKKLRD